MLYNNKHFTKFLPLNVDFLTQYPTSPNFLLWLRHNDIWMRDQSDWPLLVPHLPE